jgi:cytochrome o ubiquinol oxidase subunit 2
MSQRKQQKKLLKIGLITVLTLALLSTLTAWYLRKHSVDVLQPAGVIGSKEKNLLIFCAALSVAVVVPVFVLLFGFAWRYREDNTKGRYTPELGGSKMAETIWWLIPTILIGIVSGVTWVSSYGLDPFKPASSNVRPLHIQVVALDWKWLFIYPDQHVASVNEVAMPIGQPVDFEITSDAVMTSFWVPKLGGQMYAMPGMSTHLNLQADKPGSFNGVAANISGKGFADMRFTARALDSIEYDAWLANASHSSQKLNTTSYESLAKPSLVQTPRFYSAVDAHLYNQTVMKYMGGHDMHMTQESHQ